MSSRLRAWLIVAVAAIPAIVGAALLVARALEPATSTGGQTIASDPVPPPIFARQLCSLANDDAHAALIQGFDGGMSVVVGDKTWWMFGDTLFQAQSGKQIEQNSIAWSDSLRPDGCPQLHYYAPNGVALPFLPKDGSLTVWPVGARASGPHSFDFYTAYIYGSGPFAYSVGELGLARFDTDTMQVTVLARKLWDANSGLPGQPIGAQPVDLDAEGRLRVVMHTKNGLKLLSRVASDAMADASAYEYWDGAGWTKTAGLAASLWPPVGADATTDVQRLAAFENGANIAWNDALHQYVAVVNNGPNAIAARTATNLEGPWSEPRQMLDCLAFAEAYVPTCYSPYQHAQLAAGGGQAIVVTLTRFRIYDVVAFEIRFGTAIREYQRGSDVRYAAAPPGDGWTDRGPAFYASTVPLPGFQPIDEWSRGDEIAYAAASPGDGFQRGAAAFYAPVTATLPSVVATYRAVYNWTQGASHRLAPERQSLEADGYTRGDIAFYAP